MKAVDSLIAKVGEQTMLDHLSLFDAAFVSKIQVLFLLLSRDTATQGMGQVSWSESS